MKIFSRSKILHFTFPLFLMLTGITFCFLPGLVAGVSAAGLWQPNSSAPIHWQWQIGTPFNVSTDLIPNVTVYDIDAYDTSAGVVSALHARGFIVIAYASFGTYENWRPDAAGFPRMSKAAVTAGRGKTGWTSEVMR